MRAHAKINLFLHVGDRRSDGYHALKSLIAFAEAGDDLLVDAADTLSLTVDGPFADGCPTDETNLILRAAIALQKEAGVTKGARFKLTKSLPVASGIGGGSADAAAAFKLLTSLWRTNLAGPVLDRLALALGADLPVCLRSETSLVSGVGEIFEPPPSLPPTPVVLVNPGIPVPTGEIFRRLTIRSGAVAPDLPDRFPSPTPLAEWLRQTHNDLEAPARLIAPAIKDVLTTLDETTGCLLARMSGSGATCFGLFESDAVAASVASTIRKTHPQWWTVPTRLKS